MNKSRLILLASIILIASTYLFPLWKIDLEAPQYPEGIGLRIWIDKITGVNEYDLDNINKLNHYIGMKTIEPDSIPELKIMPYILIFFILLGIIIMIFDKKILKLSWTILLLITLSIGLYDFYIWEYDYGHNLNPNAPIKIPGMTYQPPFIGTKQLLNMRTTSMPDIGSFTIGTALILGIISSIEKRKSKSKLLFAVPLILLFSSCQKHPEAINYYNEDCANCQMTISDNRFGAELITKKGKILKFDSIECLVSYYYNFHNNDVESLWVTDFNNPPNMIKTTEAFFLKSDKIQSPMGLNISAFSKKEDLTNIKSKYGGQEYKWDDLIELVKNEWH